LHELLFFVLRNSGFTHRSCPSVRSSVRYVCPFVCRQNPYTKTRFSQKLTNLELWSLLTTYSKSYRSFTKNPLLDGPQNSQIAISQRKIFDFDGIWYTTAHLILADSHIIKFELFKNARWRKPAI